MKGKRQFKKGDILLLLLVGIIGIAIMVPMMWNRFTAQTNPNNSLIAVITRDGKQITEIDLTKLQEPQFITLNEGIRVKIKAEKGSIRFVEADCPDKICIKTGALTKPGDRAVCMPSKTIVKIQGESNLVSFQNKQVILYDE